MQLCSDEAEEKFILSKENMNKLKDLEGQVRNVNLGGNSNIAGEFIVNKEEDLLYMFLPNNQRLFFKTREAMLVKQCLGPPFRCVHTL